MLDVRIISLAQKTSLSQIRDSEIRFCRTIGVIKINLRGNGAAYPRLIQEYQEELGRRAAIVWRNLLRAHGSFGSARFASLRGDLVEAFRSQLDAVTVELTSRFRKDLKGHRKSQIGKLDDAQDRELTRHEAEIEHYVATLECSTSDGASQPAPYVVYGNLGDVNMESIAVADIVQNIGADQREALLHALDLAKRALIKARDLPARDRIELSEFVDDAAAEIIREPRKNVRRLTMTLQTLLSAIQGIASGGAAYEALHEALRDAASENGRPSEMDGATSAGSPQPDSARRPSGELA